MRKNERSKLYKDEDLLSDLNSIADFVIGNEAPDEVSFNERGTLPEALSYSMMNPNNMNALNDALSKVKELETRVSTLKNKLLVMKRQMDFKRPSKLSIDPKSFNQK